MITEMDWVALAGGAGCGSGKAEVGAANRCSALSRVESAAWLVNAAPLPWEARRYLTAVLSEDVSGAASRVDVTVRAWARLEENRSQLVWHGSVDNLDALESVCGAFHVSPANVYLDAAVAEDAVVTACAKFGWNPILASARWDFRNDEMTRYITLPWSRAVTLRKGQSRGCAVKWSLPWFGSQVWKCCEGRATPHRWEFAGTTPPAYLAALGDGLRLFRNHSEREFETLARQVEFRRGLAPWLTESLQLLVATRNQFVAIGMIPLLSERRTPNCAAA